MFRAMVHLSLNINKALAFINMYFVKKNREQGSEHFHFYIVDIHTPVRFFFFNEIRYLTVFMNKNSDLASRNHYYFCIFPFSCLRCSVFSALSAIAFFSFY